MHAQQRSVACLGHSSQNAFNWRILYVDNDPCISIVWMRYVRNYKCCSRNLNSIGQDLWKFVRRSLERGSVLIRFICSRCGLVSFS